MEEGDIEKLCCRKLKYFLNFKYQFDKTNISSNITVANVGDDGTLNFILLRNKKSTTTWTKNLDEIIKNILSKIIINFISDRTLKLLFYETAKG